MADTIRHEGVGKKQPCCPRVDCCELGDHYLVAATKHGSSERCWVIAIEGTGAARIFFCPWCGTRCPAAPVHP